MEDRWRLGRAGILNVYQYANEVLSFGDGRLLLRGVNGSGKSTAMNMLLPFLLDGDTRRIDAAGEQSGVLKSWMLSGREDPQPIGYLWVEFAMGDEYLTCGCGIRANRSSDTVLTWWWITPRRPGVDLDLVQDSRPLSAEGLRALIGSDAVFRQEDRKAYREEVRRRLFGGAEIDQHIRLLHVVRSPRVGDRIDQELPSYLHDALPQLSEAALADAAQPLDDLEEHRRNVGELARTVSTLSALQEVYGDYCRSELRRRAESALGLVAAAEHSRRAVARARSDLREAEKAMDAAAARVESLSARERELRVELQGLRDLPGYKEGAQLDDLRGHVRGQADVLKGAEGELDRRRANEGSSRYDLVNAWSTSRQDHADLGSVLHELSDEVLSAGLTAAAPDLPALGTYQLDEQGGLEAPREVSGDLVIARLSEVRAAAQHRRGDLDEVRRELKLVAATAEGLAVATRELEAAEQELQRRREALAECTSELDGATTEWRWALTDWVGDLAAELATSQLPPPAGVALDAGLADRRTEVRGALQPEVDRLVVHHERAVAAAEAAAGHQRSAVDEAAAELGGLEAMSMPEPPAQAWQRPDRGAVLAELVDFVEETDEPTRAAIEAAMEAGGLLTAEVRPDGALLVDAGTLLAFPQAAVADPLSRYLVAVQGADPVVRRVLESVSTDPSDLDLEGVTVVTLDGRFRTGVLTGRHHKGRAEHIGLAARRERLERLRAEARQRLVAEKETLATIERELRAATARRDSAAALRSVFPAGEAVDAAVLALRMAMDAVLAAKGLTAARADVRRLADDAHADAVDKSRRVAANLGLVADEDALQRVEASVGAALSAVDRTGNAVRVLLRSVVDWGKAAGRWTESFSAASLGEKAVAAARVELDRLSTRLATLEDQFGAAYEEILDRVRSSEEHLETTETVLEQARQAHLHCNTTKAQAAGNVDLQSRTAAEDEQRALGALPQLKRTLAVPGLAESVSADPTWVAAPVEESVAGLRELAVRIQAHASGGESRDVAADGVRQSLRQRRDSLGAGWDAEDRQADESLPMTVEINGPEGRLPLASAVSVVQARLSELSALLSSEQDDALRNLLQGLVAREVADKLHAASGLVARMNRRLDSITTAHGIGVSIRWRRREGLDPARAEMVTLLAKQPDLRTAEEDSRLREVIASQLDFARREDPDASYSYLVGSILDYRSWHEITLLLKRPGRPDERLTRRTPLSEGEKKIVSYLPLFAAVAASCDSLAEGAPAAPRFLLLDDAFAKVSEDNHPKLFGLLVELDLDFIATSERLWGTYATVPKLAITEVIRDASLGVVVLEHSRWDGASRTSSS